MARQEGIEPPTHSLEGCCSIQLSYWRFDANGFRSRRSPGLPCLVGAPGFEPGTSCSQSRRDTRLRYAPRASECIRTCKENQLLSFADFSSPQPTLNPRALTESSPQSGPATHETLALGDSPAPSTTGR